MHQQSRQNLAARVSMLAVLCCSGALAGPLAPPASALAPGDPEPVKVALHTEDKLDLAATWLAPRESAKKVPAAVLVHGAGGSRADLLPIALRLQKAGFAVLVLDLRGHGDSTSADCDWKKLDKDAQTRTWAFMLRDVKAGVGFATSQPGVSPNGVSLVGYGAGSALVARHAKCDERVRDIILLSPQPEQMGFTLSKDLVELAGLPIYVAAGKDEAASVKRISDAVAKAVPDSNLLETSLLKIDAAEMLTDPKLPTELARWMQSKAQPGAKGPEAKPTKH